MGSSVHCGKSNIKSDRLFPVPLLFNRSCWNISSEQTAVFIIQRACDVVGHSGANRQILAVIFYSGWTTRWSVGYSRVDFQETASYWQTAHAYIRMAEESFVHHQWCLSLNYEWKKRFYINIIHHAIPQSLIWSLYQNNGKFIAHKTILWRI